MPPTQPVSDTLGTPLGRTDYTLDDLNAKLDREPSAVVDALLWTRGQWKWFLLRHDDDHHTPGYDPDIWYDEAVRKLHRVVSDIEPNIGVYDADSGLDPEYAGLIAHALEYYETNYDHLALPPDADPISHSG